MHILFLLLLTMPMSFAEKQGSECESVELSSKVAGLSKTVELCFYRERTFFISKACQDLSCEFAQKLRTTKTPSSMTERPGAVLCKALGGGVDVIKLEGVDYDVSQCVFADEEKNSVSLNLLESWNGKMFKGPSPKKGAL